jgi:hypothetical protein
MTTATPFTVLSAAADSGQASGTEGKNPAIRSCTSARENRQPICNRLKLKVDLPLTFCDAGLSCTHLLCELQYRAVLSRMLKEAHMKPAFIFLLVLASMSAEAKIPSSAWKGGVLKRVTKEHIGRQSGELGKKPPKHGLYISYYFIEADNSLYEGDDVKLKENEKGFPVSVDAPVKFFLDGKDMYVQDDRGKAHKLRLVNVLSTGASAPQPSSADSQK